MTNFRTTFSVIAPQKKIQYNGSVLTIGSCFSDTIGSKLRSLHFDVCANPFGVLFNPFSIGEAIRMLAINDLLTPDLLFLHDGLYRHFSFHTSLADPDATVALKNMNEAISLGNKYLRTCSHLIITFGTTILYRHKSLGKIVANNHKLPASEFERIQQEPVGVISRWIEIIKLIRTINPGCSIWFTVSPVRHTKEGMVENAWSKSVALLSIHQLCKHNRELYYFPAYEIMIDDLRDYRFYAEDMIHPNAIAEAYIFDIFKNACIDSSNYALMEEMENIQKAIQHRPLFPGSEQHIQFCKSMQIKIADIQKENPDMDLTEELNHFAY